MKVVLNISFNESVQEYVMTVGHEATFGRSSKADLSFDDEKCSGKHCKIKLHPKKLEVLDLDSKNGTFLNGIRIESSQLFIGDEVAVGNIIVTLNEQKFDDEAINVLTFPGPVEDIVDEGLKLDFTGARIKNQQGKRNLEVIAKNTLEASRVQEINLRKKFKSKIRVSKEIVRERHKGRTTAAFVLDFLLGIVLFAIPFIAAIKLAHQFSKEKRLLLAMGSEILILGFYTILNFKLMKFSLGERIAGIRKIYQKQ